MNERVPSPAIPPARGHLPLVLASASPQRKYLLEQAGVLNLIIHPSGLDEDSVPFSSPSPYVQELARRKAASVAARYADHWILGADTIVCVENTVMGKPADSADAARMLRRLSGQTHQVHTGYALLRPGDENPVSRALRTDVTFKKLTEEEIAWYVSTDEALDKAGAYAVQGIGTFLVRRINGSYTNVVGLPVCEVLEDLIREGVLASRPAPADEASGGGR